MQKIFKSVNKELEYDDNGNAIQQEKCIKNRSMHFNLKHAILILSTSILISTCASLMFFRYSINNSERGLIIHDRLTGIMILGTSYTNMEYLLNRMKEKADKRVPK